MFNPYDQPALAHLVQMLYLAEQAQSVAIVSGMGIGEGMLAFNSSELAAYYRETVIARHQPVKSWRGLSTQHIIPQQGAEYKLLDLLGALEAARPHINQDAFDFLTLRDKKQSRLDCLLGGSEIMWFATDQELLSLATAFRQQMVAEAEPHRWNIPVGAYVLQREPLPRLDRLLAYSNLRLVLTPAGIGVSIVVETESEGTWYLPFWWSPDNDTNTVQVWVPPDLRFAFDILMSTIWRDACIVQCATFARGSRHRKAYEAKTPKPKHPDNTLRLPRRIYESRWADEADRVAVAHITRSAHAVGGFYRPLPDGHQAGPDTEDRAQRHGFAPPPPGYTFVRPHSRGGEVEPQNVRRVICRGLQVAKTVLG